MKSGTRVLGLKVLLAGSVLGLFFAYSVHAALPDNAIEELPFVDARMVHQVAPQGWAFFTRNPREARALPYVLENGDWRSLEWGPKANLRYAFGLDRAPRSYGVEMGLLISALNEGSGQARSSAGGDPGSDLLRELGLLPNRSDVRWQGCEKAPAACIDRSSSQATLVNESPAPALCGQVGFAFQEPLPWAWAAGGGTETMPSEVIRVEVKC